MTNRFALVLAAALSIVSGSAFAQSYNPGTQQVPADRQDAPTAQRQAPPAAQPSAQPVRPQVNQREVAQQNFASWQDKKKTCYLNAGLKENEHFRVNPNNPQGYQVNGRVHLPGSGFNSDAITACDRM